jgi:type IV pilus assembly protein PilC
MPKYIYTAKSYNGETKNGDAIAQDEKTLAQQLRSEGFLVTSMSAVKEEKGGGFNQPKFLDIFNKVPLKEKMVFARNLSVMISSGLTVSRAVSNLALQVEHKGFKKILNDIFDEMQAGKTLSEGLAKYQDVFGDLFVNMVRVGEVSGNLDGVLKIVAVQLEKEHDLKGKVKGAMIYPAVILSVMVVIGILMLTTVLPKMMSVFTEMDAQLPPMTQFLINLSDAIRNNALVVLIVLFALAIVFKIYLKQEAGKKALGYLAVHIPIFGNIVRKVNSARFARIFSSLLRSGVGSVDALKIISNTLSNYYYKKALLEGMEEVQKGIPLSTILSDNQEIFPMLVSQIVKVGEETGKTETVLLQLAEFYEDEVDQITKNMSSIIEPLLMVVIGSAVGFFAVAMLQPMYSLMDNIK